MTWYERLFYVELDTGSQPLMRVSRRQYVYRDTKDYVLYVTLSERRLKGLIKCSERIKEIALFTTLQRVLDDPFGNIWTDFFGNETRI